MHKAIRSQADDLGDEYSVLTALDMGASRDMARQEFKAEADINVMLAKFGVFAPQRVSQWGQEIDYGIDLQTALEAISGARRAWFQMTPELKDKYPTWQDLLNGLDSGEFKLDVNPEPIPAPVAAPLAPQGT